jgi:hypothetical protein
VYNFGIVTSKKFRTEVKDRYPVVFKNPDYIKFLYFVLFKSRSETGTIIHHQYIMKKVLNKRDNTFSTGAFLEHFQEAIDFPLNVTAPSYEEGKARTFNPSIPEDLEQLLLAEVKTPRRKREEPVYFLDGTTFTPRKQSKKVVEVVSKHYSEEEPKSIITSYFKDINPVAYNPYYGNVDDLIEKLNRREDEMSDKTYRSPQYFENNTFERVWAQGMSLQNLKSEYRSSILKGCIEADLASCHVVICAYDWNMPMLKELLENGVNIWKYLHKQMNMDFSPITKADFKTGLYAIIYGGGDKAVKAGMEYISEEDKTRFLQLPIIQEFIKFGKEKRGEATTNKGIKLADGTWLSSRRATKELRAIKPYQLVSWRAISIERYIIESVFEVATQNKNSFRILSLEHDGFTFTLLGDTKREGVLTKLANAVAERGRKIGIPMALEVKE